MASIALKHATGNSTSLHSPAANPSANITLKVPSTTGTAGHVLKVATANHSSTNAELEWAADTSGKILQYKVSSKTDTASTGSNSYAEISSDFRITLTPTASNSTIIVTAYIYINNNNNANSFRMRRNTATDFSGTSSEVMQPDDFAANEDAIAQMYGGNEDFMFTLPVTAYETSSNTTARTYSPFWRVGGGTMYLNRFSTGDYQGVSTMTVMEVSA